MGRAGGCGGRGGPHSHRGHGLLAVSSDARLDKGHCCCRFGCVGRLEPPREGDRDRDCEKGQPGAVHDRRSEAWWWSVPARGLSQSIFVRQKPANVVLGGRSGIFTFLLADRHVGGR